MYGIGSGAFASSVILAAVVMYDAAGVRQKVDKQSAILNHLLVEFPRTQLEFESFLRQLVGHTRFQVAAGAALGVLLALWRAKILKSPAYNALNCCVALTYNWFDERL